MSNLCLVVRLWVKDQSFAEFQKFEESAFAIMRKHGGNVLKVIDNWQATNGEPHEIHLIKFPSVGAFEAYKSDPALSNLSDVRAACIDKTEIEFVEAHTSNE